MTVFTDKIKVITSRCSMMAQFALGFYVWPFSCDINGRVLFRRTNEIAFMFYSSGYFS